MGAASAAIGPRRGIQSRLMAVQPDQPQAGLANTLGVLSQRHFDLAVAFNRG